MRIAWMLTVITAWFAIEILTCSLFSWPVDFLEMPTVIGVCLIAVLTFPDKEGE